MKRKFLFVTIEVLAVLIVTAFWVGKASASCFSDTSGNYFETYICWLKNHSITFGYGDGTYRQDNNITRGEMAAMLERQAEVPPDTGLIMVTPGNGEWLKRSSGDDLSFENYGYRTEIKKTTAGTAWITLEPSIPTVLYGRRLQLVGIDFCYQADASATVTALNLDTFSSTDGTEGSYTHRVDDNDDHAGTTCRYYALPSAYTLAKTDGVVFYVAVQYTAGGIFKITRTTFVLQPTDTAVTPFTP